MFGERLCEPLAVAFDDFELPPKLLYLFGRAAGNFRAVWRRVTFHHLDFESAESQPVAGVEHCVVE